MAILASRPSMTTSKVASLPKVLPVGNSFRRQAKPFGPTPSIPEKNGHKQGRPRSTSRRVGLALLGVRSGLGFGDPIFGRGKVNETAKPLDVQDCLKQMMDFVKEHNLQSIIGGDGCSDEQLEAQLRPQAKVASLSPTKLRHVTREMIMQLAIMSLYDLAILIDDSTSMVFEQGGERKKALKKVLHFLADLYGAVSDDMRGIKAIRFLNGTDDLCADHLRSNDEIDQVIDGHVFEGLTCIGAGLMRKILKPFVFDPSPVSKKPRTLRRMERPLLIMVITDGAVEGEPKGWVEQAVKSVMTSLEARGVGNKAVVFQFALVGNDEGAKEYLRQLDDESTVKDFVDTLSGNDLMDLINQQEADGEEHAMNYQYQLIKLLLGPIIDVYDDLPDNLVPEFSDIQDDIE